MYSEKFQKSLAAVEAAREKNIALEPERMTAQQKEDLLREYHPDYKKEEFRTLEIGPNKGEQVPIELAEMLQAHSRITADSVDLSNPDYDVDVLIIGGGGAGSSAAIEAHEAGANVMIVTKLRIGDANTMKAVFRLLTSPTTLPLFTLLTHSAAVTLRLRENCSPSWFATLPKLFSGSATSALNLTRTLTVQ